MQWRKRQRGSGWKVVRQRGLGTLTEKVLMGSETRVFWEVAVMLAPGKQASQAEGRAQAKALRWSMHPAGQGGWV